MRNSGGTLESAELLERAAWAEQFCLSQETGLAEQLELVRAFALVPRERFLDSGMRFRAYDDSALPIGFGQTISKPSTVAQMLSRLDVRPGMRVLEVGVGSGYVCALLHGLGAEVFGIERVSALVVRAKQALSAVGASDVILRCADGTRGWKECAPFDRIIVSAALEEAPHHLLGQLSSTGRLVAPISRSGVMQGGFATRLRYEEEIDQRLVFWEARAGSFVETDLGPCRFVKAA